MEKIYLDNAATSKTYPQVAQVVYDTMMNYYGNASSVHSMGREAMRIVEDARELIANDLNCAPNEIIFTSGACEANSLAFTASNGHFLITSKMEHKSIAQIVEHTDQALFVRNDLFGRIDLHDLEALLSKENALLTPFVSIQAANNEIGVIQNITAIGELVSQYDGIYHTDATQLYPYQQIDVSKSNIQMMSVSAQKFGGPKGIGFLYVKSGIPISPLIYGAQENGMRGGTYNTPLIAGMAEALRITRAHQDDINNAIKQARDSIAYMINHIADIHINGPIFGDKRLINNISVVVKGCRADRLVAIADLYGLEVSAGSACDNGTSTPSATLKAIGLSDEDALSTIRITIGQDITVGQLCKCSDLLPLIIQKARQM